MKFPIGGKVRERLGADLVKLQNQQYSLDERRCVKIAELLVLHTYAPIMILTPERQQFFRCYFDFRSVKIMKTKSQGSQKIQPMTHKLTITAMLSAAATVLMFIDFSVPLMPSFIKLDVSELPALLASFSLGPVYGVVVCLIKNLVNLSRSTTSGIGEICNFLLGACFVFSAGLIYKNMKNRKGALIGSLAGAVIMAILSLPINYYITYPIYANFMPMEAIIDMYKVIYSGVNSLLDCLLVFNVPFTLFKGLIDVALTFLIYKKLSPVLHK